jgi:ribosomal protein S18 acetylase RimI-like enzyme
MTESDREAIATLTAAFVDDPLMGWIFADPSTRPELLATWWTWMLVHRPGHARVCATDDHRSAALWYGPDPVDDDAVRDFPALLASLLGESRALEKLRGLAVIPAAHPHDERHWYLAAVGTRPAAQGQGSALRVLTPVLAEADELGIGAYLESSNVRNVAFYERLGFVATGIIQIPGGPILTPMWRAAPGRRGTGRGGHRERWGRGTPPRR